RSKSTHLLEYPHSLSYQDSTLTKSPSITFVYAESTIDECGLPLKSTDTSSAVMYSRRPFIGPSAASLRAALTSAAVVFLSTSAARSTTDTFGVGTRISH